MHKYNWHTYYNCAGEWGRRGWCANAWYEEEEEGVAIV